MSPWRMVAIALAALGLTCVAISFVSGDMVALAYTNHGCIPEMRFPSRLWLLRGAVPLMGALATWIATRPRGPRTSRFPNSSRSARTR